MCDRTPELSVGATSQLSTRATGPALECRTQQQAEVLVHVTGSLAHLAGKYSPSSDLVETKAARAHTPGPDNHIPLPLGDHLLFSAAERPDHVAAAGGEAGAAPGTGGGKERGEQQEKQKEGLEVEMNMKSFPNTQGAMIDDEPEVEVVDAEPEVEVVDMSLEDSPASPEEAGANARSPSPTPDSPGFCRDELYKPGEEADMLLDEAEAAEAGEESPPYVAPGSRTPSPSALAALYTQVRGASPRTPDMLESLERGRRSREEETRRATRARLLLDQERRDKESARERSRSRSRPRKQEPEQVKGDSREEQGEAEKRRYRSASTWTPPRKRSISPQGPIRCTSPHNCRSSATGGCRSQFIDPNASGSRGAAGRRSRSLTPEGRERSPASRERLARWPGTMDLERERMKEVWCRMEKEQTALLDTRDGMLKLAAKGTTELWRLKQRMECLMKGFENKICQACSEETRSRDRPGEVARRGPSSDREYPPRGTSSDREKAGPHPNKEATPTLSTAGCWAPGCTTPASSATGSSSVPATTGEKGNRPVPNYGHSGVLLMPVKIMPHPDQVDPAAWPGRGRHGHQPPRHPQSRRARWRWF